MALQCSLQIHQDYAEVHALNDPSLRCLKFDMSDTYCRIFETTKQQSRDYLEEIVRWARGIRPDNMETLVRSIHTYLSAKRRAIGMRQ